MNNPDRTRRARDLITGLIVVALGAAVTALPAAIAYEASGRVPGWAWLPLWVPAWMLVVLAGTWLRGGYLPPPVDIDGHSPTC